MDSPSLSQKCSKKPTKWCPVRLVCLRWLNSEARLVSDRRQIENGNKVTYNSVTYNHLPICRASLFDLFDLINPDNVDHVDLGLTQVPAPAVARLKPGRGRTEKGNKVTYNLVAYNHLPLSRLPHLDLADLNNEASDRSQAPGSTAAKRVSSRGRNEDGNKVAYNSVTYNLPPLCRALFPLTNPDNYLRVTLIPGETATKSKVTHLSVSYNNLPWEKTGSTHQRMLKLVAHEKVTAAISKVTHFSVSYKNLPRGKAGSTRQGMLKSVAHENVIAAISTRESTKWPNCPNCTIRKVVAYKIVTANKGKKRQTGLCIEAIISKKFFRTFKDRRHVKSGKLTVLLQANDVESNPGPPSSGIKLTLITQNCRGLADDRKLKHLMNNCHKIGANSATYIVALQETMIKNDQKIIFGWRGTHVFTPGTGHGRGCITLMPPHIQPLPNSIVQLNQRGHIFKVRIDQRTAVVANAYAPTGITRDKIDYIRKLKDEINLLREPSDDVYLMGDLNTVFNSEEIQARSFSNQEQRHSNQIKQIHDALSLDDVWQNDHQTHTWRQPGTRKSSRLDRIYYQHSLVKKSCTVDWTFTNSDHGAVVATFTDPTKVQARKPLRLNPELIKNPALKSQLLQEYRNQIEQIPTNWDPHQVLEFHKCALRSSYSLINCENKKRNKLDYDHIKEDLHSHISALEHCKNDVAKANRLMNKINKLKATITKLNLERGQALANKLKTKWYNEGERSNKYFLGILRKKELNGQLTELEIDDRIESQPEAIERHIVSFYSSLYNQEQHQPTPEESNNLLEQMQTLNDEEVRNITQPITEAMLLKTLKSMEDSCPGPDGIPYSYIKATWEWFGPVMLKAWEHSIRINKLPDSHRASWLKLIPKAGKNTKDLKNWRPITLSNCDHKVITKTISNMMAENLERIITGNQTAYLRGRSISDNLRIITMANKLAKKDPRMKGLLIALDAKKAFDSVSHSFIASVLVKIGLAGMVPIFELLYKDSRVDIMINDKLCNGYYIKNGVKQGDALSCILFILAMEPLIRNIDANPRIEKLKSTKFKVEMPKCLGYADDISIITTDSINCVRETITEYETFTNISGLQLNADKTEIFQLNDGFTPRHYQFAYQGTQTVVMNSERIKINGLHLDNDPEETHKANFEAVKEKMNKQFAAWANRGLCLLGKILIYKTFGLSQIIYTTRVITFTEKEHTELRNQVYKFLWNRNYQAAKAPDRIKRKYLNTPISRGGFGMIDHEVVTKAMNARQTIVNLNGRHPIRKILENLLIDSQSYFHCSLRENIDGPGAAYAASMNEINMTLLNKELHYLEQDRLAKDMFLRERLIKVARPERRNCLEIAILRNRGITTVRQLLNDQQMANHFRMRILHYRFATIMDACLLSGPQDLVNEHYIPIKGKYKLAIKASSKDIRMALNGETDAINFKITQSNELTENVTKKIKRLKSTKAKSFALRLLHGDVYTGIKLLKFGLANSDECEKCRQPESLLHLVKDCWYSGLIWSKICKLYQETDYRRQTYEKNSLDFVTASKLSMPKFKLHIEILRKLSNKDRPNILPRMLITQTLDYLIICDNDHRKYYQKLRNSMQPHT